MAKRYSHGTVHEGEDSGASARGRGHDDCGDRPLKAPSGVRNPGPSRMLAPMFPEPPYFPIRPRPGNVPRLEYGSALGSIEVFSQVVRKDD